MLKPMDALSSSEKYQNRHTLRRRKSRRRVLYVAAATAVIILILLLCLRGCQKSGTGALQRDAAAKAGIMPGMSDTEIADRLNRIVKDSEVNVTMNAQPVLKDGTLNVAIENIPANRFAFRVKVVMDKSQKELFETDIIDPGYYIESVKISEKLAPGTYDATASFTCYDPESLQIAGNTGLKIVVLVPGNTTQP
ncbi:MAG: hypothetical protein RRZ93_02935 [Ruthenibacterium sp.]